VLKKVPLRISRKNIEKSCLITLAKCTYLKVSKNTLYRVFCGMNGKKFSTLWYNGKDKFDLAKNRGVNNFFDS
jgi:hypothetical protein